MSLAEEVTKKHDKLLVTISQMDEEDELKCYECQIGLIRERTLDSDYTVRPVTAKHNIAITKVKGVVESFQMAALHMPKTGIQRNYTMRFPEAGYEYESHSECDTDITWANVRTSSPLQELAYSFERVRVRADFQCGVGQKIAIVV
jgi:hypothetical protein